MNKCKNCGREFEGKFCPDCGIAIEERSDVALQTESDFQDCTAEEAEKTDCVYESESYGKVCPNCGTEGGAESKFCAICGCALESEESKNSEAEFVSCEDIHSNVDTESVNNSVLSKILKVFSKIYRYLIAGGMIFVGFVSFLCLSSPMITENVLGLKNALVNGFEALGGDDIPTNLINTSRMLLLVSLGCLAYGGYQLYTAFKKPYRFVKKYPYWIADGIIMFVLIVLGGIVAGEANSKELMNGKLGSGFAMCIVMGVFGLLFLGARIFYELKLFKWEDTGLSQERIAQALEKRPKKQRVEKKIKPKDQKPGVPIQGDVYNGKSTEKRKVLLCVLDILLFVIPIICAAMLIKFFELSLYQYRFELEMDILVSVGLSLGFIWLILFAVRFFCELRVYKWVNPHPGRKLSRKKKLCALLILCAVSIVVIVPSVVVSNNIFRIGKVDRIILGDGKDYVRKVLGEPYIAKDGYYEYYSKNYIKLYEQLQEAMGVDNFALAKNKDDDWDIDLDDEFGDLFEDLEKLAELEEKLMKLTYKYIRVEFDLSGTVESILYDAERCDSKEIKKTVKTYDIEGDINVMQNEILKLDYTVRYNDGSFFKGHAVNQVCNDINQNSVKWYDRYGNEFSCKIYVEEINEITRDMVTSIAGGDRQNLTEFKVPSNIVMIEADAFKDCYNLQSVIFENGSQLKIIGDYAFSGCRNIVSINIPESVTDIGERAFSGCNNLESITMPNELLRIGSSAFSGCGSLAKIIIPVKVNYIGERAFAYCDSLTIYCEAERAEAYGWDHNWNYSDCPVVWRYQTRY